MPTWLSRDIFVEPSSVFLRNKISALLSVILPYMNRRRRERKEYLLRKELEQKEAEMAEKKNRIEESLDTNKKIPHGLRGQAGALLDEIIYEGKLEEISRPPKALVTTSREPSSQLLAFVKHISVVINAEHFARGKMSEEELSDTAHRHGYTHVILVHENKGRPSSMVISCYPYGPTLKFTIIDHFMTRRIAPFSPKVYFICDNLGSEVGLKIKERLSLLFPKVNDARRIVSLVNRNDIIAFRHFLIERGEALTLNKDFGMDLRLFEIRKGTFELDGELEWVYRPFINSAKSGERLAAVDSGLN
jgi:U3 small nucleolar ribonucleoprotein protein IMP4